jgi:hypothetical protein
MEVKMIGLRVIGMFFICFLFSNPAFGSGAKTVLVNSYTKSDGTYVSAHWRSPPDGGGSSVYIPSSYPQYSPYSSAGVSGNTKTSEPETKRKELFTYKVKIFYKYSSSGYIYDFEKSGYEKDNMIVAEEKAVYEAQEELRDFLYEHYSLNHVLVAKEMDRVFSQTSCATVVRNAVISLDGSTVYTKRETVMTCTGKIPTVNRKKK